MVYSLNILRMAFKKKNVDSWLKYGEPWSIRKEDEFVTVDFEDMTVKAIPYDTQL